MNPLQLMKFKERYDIFQREHPRVLPFFHALNGRVVVGSILEIKLTNPDGTEMVSNIKVTENDMKTIALMAGKEG